MHVMKDEGQDLLFLTLSLVVNLFVTMLHVEWDRSSNKFHKVFFLPVSSEFKVNIYIFFSK